jgi:hypothetical protein
MWGRVVGAVVVGLSGGLWFYESAGSASSAQVRYSEVAQSSEDRGCCVLKPSLVKTSWKYRDNEFRRECARFAKAAAIDWDFYKDKHCREVRQNH